MQQFAIKQFAYGRRVTTQAMRPCMANVIHGKRLNPEGQEEMN